MRRNLWALIVSFTLFAVASALVGGTEDEAPSDQDLIRSMNVTKYVLVIEQGYRYDLLKKKSQELSRQTGVPFDSSLDYDRKRGLHIPDDDSDAVYAGQYVFRRDDGLSISIEMANALNEKAPEKLMVIVGGIQTDPGVAKQWLGKFRPFAPKAWLVQHKFYMGCMH